MSDINGHREKISKALLKTGTSVCGTTPPTSSKHWIFDRTVSLLGTRRQVPPDPNHNSTRRVIRRQVKLSIHANRKAWWTQKAEEMEDTKNAGNVRQLFHLIRLTGPRKPLVSKLSFLLPITYWKLQVIVLVPDVAVSVTESRFIIMTYSARTQRKPALSVRTRALIHKYHERIISQRVMGWNSCEMRLRARLNNCAPWEVTTRTSSVEDGFSKVNSDDVTSDEIPSGSVPSEIAALGGESRAPVSQTGSSACSTASTESGSIVQCKWDGCGSSLEQSQLVTHIQHVHVLPQMISNRRKCFACLWRDCRVYRRPSVSAAWLESHILHHTDAKGKPFRCIFDGCTLRFSTSILLERHVQRAHMRVTRTQTGSLPAQLTNTLSSVNESPKLITTTAGQSSNGALGQITASPTQNDFALIFLKYDTVTVGQREQLCPPNKDYCKHLQKTMFSLAIWRIESMAVRSYRWDILP
ncbi:zinc finger protein AEBP2 [Clonorchis sinensis]|uniref:Zinc finger protein AEBP2 n=1 Tax=Clonorchis sinensis TaxID=79923 RepID=G7YHH4_CLOSI|nr:zinc finger protein AEBP2 [Clonorchis sinensis]